MRFTNLASVVVEQDIVEDIRKMSLEDRKSLSKGIRVVIYLDGKAVYYGVPKRALMAISALANQQFTTHPNDTELHLKSDVFTKEGICAVCEWIIGVCNKTYPYSIQACNGAASLAAFKIYQTGRALGLHFNYLYPIFMTLHSRVRDVEHFLSYDELEAVTKCESDDRLYKYVASIYSNLRYQGKIPDIEDFNAFVDKHPRFAKTMAEQDNRQAAVRAEREAATAEREASHRARQASREAFEARMNMTELQRLAADNEAEIERADRRRLDAKKNEAKKTNKGNKKP